MNPPTTSADALKQMQTYSSTAPKLSDLYTGAQTELGVGDARTRSQQLKDAATSTEALIRGVDPSVTGRLQGGMATEAQRQRLVALETQPLTEMYTTQNSAYNSALGNYQDLMGQADKLANARYGDSQNSYNNLKDIYTSLTASEQSAEDKRRWQAQQDENIRQFNASLAQANKNATGYSPSFGSLPTGTGANPGAAKTPAAQPVSTPQTSAYNFVMGMKGKNNIDIVSDFNAAKNWYEKTGNPTDAYKLQYYKQMFPNLFANATWRSPTMSY